MSRSVNKVILVGNLGRDAETTYTRSGSAVTKFSVATTRSWKDQQTEQWKEETNWTNIVLWRQENLANYLIKGKQVYVEGRLQTRSYDDKDGKKVYATEVIGDQVLLLGGKSDADSNGNGTQQKAQAQNGRSNGHQPKPGPTHADEFAGKGADDVDPFAGMGVTEEDVPF